MIQENCTENIDRSSKNLSNSNTNNLKERWFNKNLLSCKIKSFSKRNYDSPIPKFLISKNIIIAYNKTNLFSRSLAKTHLSYKIAIILAIFSKIVDRLKEGLGILLIMELHLKTNLSTIMIWKRESGMPYFIRVRWQLSSMDWKLGRSISHGWRKWGIDKESLKNILEGMKIIFLTSHKKAVVYLFHNQKIKISMMMDLLRKETKLGYMTR